jgi:hypothetical protein
MSNISDIFREIPSKTEVEEWLALIQIHGLSDSHSITEETFSWDSFNQILLKAEPYYFPCKAKKFLHKQDMEMKNAITVLRQIVKPHGYTFRTHERVAHGKKYYEYFLTKDLINLPTKPTTNVITFD